VNKVKKIVKDALPSNNALEEGFLNVERLSFPISLR
jgi:hypothetical protein